MRVVIRRKAGVLQCGCPQGAHQKCRSPGPYCPAPALLHGPPGGPPAQLCVRSRGGTCSGGLEGKVGSSWRRGRSVTTRASQSWGGVQRRPIREGGEGAFNRRREWKRGSGWKQELGGAGTPAGRKGVRGGARRRILKAEQRWPSLEDRGRRDQPFGGHPETLLYLSSDSQRDGWGWGLGGGGRCHCCDFWGTGRKLLSEVTSPIS